MNPSAAVFQYDWGQEKDTKASEDHLLVMSPIQVAHSSHSWTSSSGEAAACWSSTSQAWNTTTDDPTSIWNHPNDSSSSLDVRFGALTVSNNNDPPKQPVRRPSTSQRSFARSISSPLDTATSSTYSSMLPGLMGASSGSTYSTSMATASSTTGIPPPGFYQQKETSHEIENRRRPSSPPPPALKDYSNHRTVSSQPRYLKQSTIPSDDPSVTSTTTNTTNTTGRTIRSYHQQAPPILPVPVLDEQQLGGDTATETDGEYSYQEQFLEDETDTEDDDDTTKSHSTTKQHDWLHRMELKLDEIPIGNLDPNEIPLSAIMNAWAKTKSPEGAAMVEKLLQRARKEHANGNRKVIPTTKMYTMAGT